MRKLLLLSLLALLLIGCGPSAAPEPTPVPRPTLDLATAAVTPGLSGPTQQAAATPLPTASPMPTATETPMATTYTVQAGDTLSAIAERFGVTLAALAAANDIANPNSIRVGQVLIIPGRSEGSAPGAPATDTPEPAAPSVSGTPTLTPSTPVPLAEGPRGLPMESPEYGMQAFLWWRPETAHRDLGMIREAGFGWVKQNFAWRDIELAKGVFDWSVTDRIMDQIDEFGLKVLVRLDHQPEWAGGGYPLNGPPDDLEDFGDFCRAVAERYRGRVEAYEVWNEPNLAREWGGRSPDPGEYVELLKVGYRGLKEGDPGVVVVTAGLTPTGTRPPIAMPDDEYLRGMYEAGMRGYYDVVGVHAAGYKAPPELSPEEAAASEEWGGERFFCFRRVEDLRAIMEENGDSGRQVAILEFGWTSDPRPESPYHWHAVDEFTKADYLVRAYRYAREHWRPWIGLMSLIYMGDPDWTPADEQWWWSINNPDVGSPRAAYIELQRMEK